MGGQRGSKDLSVFVCDGLMKSCYGEHFNTHRSHTTHCKALAQLHVTINEIRQLQMKAMQSVHLLATALGIK